MISFRNVRHDALAIIDNAKKDKEIGEDDAKRLSDQVEQTVNKMKADAETVSKEKEKEIMTV
jgi:ribosome recycling factor